MIETARRGSVLGVALWLCGCYTGIETVDAPAADAGTAGTDSGTAPADGDGSESGGTDGDPVLPDVDRVGVSGLRRLTATEYDATIEALLGLGVDSALLLPEDPRTPYDNDFTLQTPSEALIAGTELLAGDLAEAALSTAAGRDAIVGCTPTGPDDVACFEQFVDAFGVQALRRPLTDEQRAAFTAQRALGVAQGDFYAGVEAALRAFLQHPQFLYRVERGTEVDGEPGVYRLDDWEVASRLSYLLWGSMPDDALFEAAAAGELTDGGGIGDATMRMLEDPRALERVQRFHALWMGFEQLPHSGELSAALNQETAALIQRVVFDQKRPWQDLLTADETYVDAMLAEHYGLPAPAGSGPDWVKYPADSGRKGLFGHGSFLSLGGAFDDTSPTQRGIAVRTRLFCEDELEPPDEVDADNPPAEEDSPCKWDRYLAHRADPGCASCHQLLDPIGFGLENYGADGRYRTHDVGYPECEIHGEGEVPGIGTFSGPAQLADLLVDDGRIEACAVKQFYRFAMGRFELDEVDEAYIEALSTFDADNRLVFDQMVVDFVTSIEFRFRRDEPLEEEE